MAEKPNKSEGGKAKKVERGIQPRAGVQQSVPALREESDRVS